ncbi:Arylsulfatase A [Sphingobacterium nematocida]|uniref:Arylsulfatase A n=2 Tax=Sphingobacterium nematocida TaxID=1513896 RepID=A0A1T5B3V3_9SPHI|nr:Arylsulfatase A [Sphingobacterium nematocida]
MYDVGGEKYILYIRIMKLLKPLSTLAALVLLLSPLQAQKTALKPNIIFILADDMGYGDIGSYGQKHIKTPVLDRLAAEGRRYTQFYAGSTVCAPSRASLMTGQHTGQVYIRGNGEVPLRNQDTIVTQVLKQAGYTNGMVGKWGLGLAGTTGTPEKKGWDFFTGFLHHVEGHFQLSNSVWRLQNGHSVKMKVDEDTYVNELFAKEAVRFIEENKDNPFFLYVSFTVPHAELKVPERYLKPYLNADGTSKFAPEKAQPAGLHYGEQPYPKAAYAAMVTSMDDYTGWILKKLDELGIAENTLVIFTSDNGTHKEGGRTMDDIMQVFESTGGLRGVKRDLYEGGIRTPFIAKWPGGIKPGTVSDFTGTFWDIMPTFAEMTKTKAPMNIDGVSFWKDLTSGKQIANRPLYWEFNEGGFKQAVRLGDWKAIRFYKDGKPQRTELYNIAKDRFERNDLSDQNRVKVSELERLMDQQRTESENKIFAIKREG